jgi:hypothetical protein
MASAHSASERRVRGVRPLPVQVEERDTTPPGERVHRTLYPSHVYRRKRCANRSHIDDSIAPGEWFQRLPALATC